MTWTMVYTTPVDEVFENGKVHCPEVIFKGVDTLIIREIALYNVDMVPRAMT